MRTRRDVDAATFEGRSAIHERLTFGFGGTTTSHPFRLLHASCADARWSAVVWQLREIVEPEDVRRNKGSAHHAAIDAHEFPDEERR